MSGLDFQQRLQKAGHQISIIFYNRIRWHSDDVNAMKFGAEMLTKPFDGQKLLDTVEQTLAGDSMPRK